jgi:hypothetical protein
MMQRVGRFAERQFAKKHFDFVECRAAWFATAVSSVPRAHRLPADLDGKDGR